MEKINELTSENIVQQNIERLKEIFPTAFSEGKLVVEELQALVGEYIQKDKEFYQMTWAGKTEAQREANKVSTGTLRPSREESKDWDSTGNIFIEGDNLEVLKLLQKSYSNKIKMIYIDPPYNTGKDFVYKDNYKDNLNNYLELSGQKDEEGKKLSTNTDSDGRYHSNWLNMMYPRLKLARNLMTDDGVIFISIDDNEQSNLKKLCDEIFGEENFVSNIVWEGGRNNDSKYISISHEYILCYFKNLNLIKEKKIFWREKKEGLDKIYSKVKELVISSENNFEEATKLLKLWYKNMDQSNPIYKQSHYSQIDEKGVFYADNISWPGGGGPKYDVLHPITNKPVKIPSRGWLFSSPERMQEFINNGLVKFGIDEQSVPTLKAYLKDREYQVPYSIFYQDGRASTKRLMKMFGSKIFENPKDENIISSIIRYHVLKEDIVLDFFSGSGSTAHAVMALNAEDGGSRKCISVQLPEPTDEKSEAYKEGYKTIAEITKERIRRAGELVKQENKNNDRIENLDAGFRVFKLDSSNILAWDTSVDEFEGQLDMFAENNGDHIKSNRTEEDVLFEILLKYGLELTLPIEEKVVGDCKIYNIGFGSMYICLSDQIKTDVATTIGEWHKESSDSNPSVIFKDSGFANDADKTNTVQTLRQVGIENVKSI